MHKNARTTDRSPNAAEQFGVLQQAYEVLSNPSLKKTYDFYGERALTKTCKWTVVWL